MLVVAIDVLAEIVGDGEEPGGDIVAGLVAVAGFIDAEEDIVGEVCRRIDIASELSEEEAL